MPQQVSDIGGFVHSVASILLVVKLMTVGHPRARPYYGEICGGAYADMQLQVKYKYSTPLSVVHFRDRKFSCEDLIVCM